MRQGILALLLMLPSWVNAQNCEYPSALIVLDRSMSMRGNIDNKTKWDIATQAINRVLADYGESTHFGLMIYPGPSGSGANGIEGPVGACDFNYQDDGCEPSAPHCTPGEVVVEMGAGTADQISASLAWPESLSHSYTPTWQSLEAADRHFLGLGFSERRRFVILITDGWQCCGLYRIDGNYRCEETSGTSMIDRVRFLRDHDVTSFILGFGGQVDRNSLHHMAVEAGTGRPGCNPDGENNNCYYQADNEVDLRFMLDEIVVRITEEVCDGLDNDCDGVVDNISEPCVGPCGAGERLCSGGDWGECAAQEFNEEICNNFDDDCDGQIDEELIRSCSTQCGMGSERCLRGAWIDCDAPLERPDICDGLDNDCDGNPDPGCDCVPGETRSCGSDAGSCRTGIQSCVEPGVWADQCEGGIGPRPEICNNRDDDCDGQVDGITQSCSGPCGNGEATCRAGRWVECNAPSPEMEICNARDDDCDGHVDEGLSRRCESSCGAGQEICQQGGWGDCNARAPVEEICNNFDDDCDDWIDEDLSRSCQSQCGQGQERCLSGQWLGCDAPQPVEEICDGLDNDCDGEVDEALRRTCSTACGSGDEICLGGAWAGCDAPPLLDELCNGIDDDCDDTIDEDCDCLDGELQACGPDEGACVAGQQLCVGGAWGACEGAREPEEEICDTIDNDCDGEFDEDLEPLDCSNICGPGSSLCVEGEWQECDAPPILIEVCDGFDNNCDGETDEGCDCLPGEIRACGDGRGECPQGSQRCDNNGQWGFCDGEGLPHPERCDFLDNDCDGEIDEDLLRECSTRCGEKTQTCSEGGWAECSAQAPIDEICGNGIDDDCDGEVDERCDCVAGEQRDCGENTGICEFGLQICEGGIWGTCEGRVEGGDEICNALDDDCDGETDEGELCPPELRCICGGCVGPCQAGECGGDARCVNGFCVEDHCPNGFICEIDRCVSGTPPDAGLPQDSGGGYVIPKDEGLEEDGGTISGTSAEACNCRLGGGSSSALLLLMLPALLFLRPRRRS